MAGEEGEPNLSKYYPVPNEASLDDLPHLLRPHSNRADFMGRDKGHVSLSLSYTHSSHIADGRGCPLLP